MNYSSLLSEIYFLNPLKGFNKVSCVYILPLFDFIMIIIFVPWIYTSSFQDVYTVSPAPSSCGFYM